MEVSYSEMPDGSVQKYRQNKIVRKLAFHDLLTILTGISAYYCFLKKKQCTLWYPTHFQFYSITVFVPPSILVRWKDEETCDRLATSSPCVHHLDFTISTKFLTFTKSSRNSLHQLSILLRWALADVGGHSCASWNNVNFCPSMSADAHRRLYEVIFESIYSPLWYPPSSPFINSLFCFSPFPFRYSSSMKSLSNRFMHLTNYSINKKNDDFTPNEDYTACEGHKW